MKGEDSQCLLVVAHLLQRQPLRHDRVPGGLHGREHGRTGQASGRAACDVGRDGIKGGIDRTSVPWYCDAIPRGLRRRGLQSIIGWEGSAMQSEDLDFEIVDDVLIEYTGDGGDVVIPAGVTEIGDCAFLGCTGLTSVVIPESVTKIGCHSFDKGVELVRSCPRSSD